MTSQLHRQWDRHGHWTSGLRTHVAISYVWSEWRDRPEDRLPSWPLLQKRLQSLLGADASPDIKAVTRGSSRCWIDCICIDQDSTDDKAYWIPRMDEIYYEARCTILLLRSTLLQLEPLLRIRDQVRCSFRGPPRFRDLVYMAPHECLLCQSCASLPAMIPEDLETDAIQALRELTQSTWRQRAWILQEILLSRNYLLSWDDSGSDISLADAAVIAALLFRRNHREVWLDEFASWCRKLWFLRQNYEGGNANELCDANVMQLASGLVATVQADKYYALCGILQLQGVKPNPEHSADQALDTVVRALTKEGRMSWLYAVPPVVQTTGLKLSDGMLAPCITTRCEPRLRMFKRHRATFNSTSLCVQAVSRGRITRSIPLSDVLDTAFTHLRNTRDFSFPDAIAYCSQVPGIIRRLSLEVIDPLLDEPIFGRVSKAFGLLCNVQSRIRRAWLCVMFFGFIDEFLVQELCVDASTEEVQMILAAAMSLQRHLKRVQTPFCVLFWVDEGQRESPEHVSLGYHGCSTGSSVFQLRDEPEIWFIANTIGIHGGTSEFLGPLLHLDVRETTGPRPSTLVAPTFWKAWGQPKATRPVQFNYK